MTGDKRLVTALGTPEVACGLSTSPCLVRLVPPHVVREKVGCRVGWTPLDLPTSWYSPEHTSHVGRARGQGILGPSFSAGRAAL